MSNTVRPYFRLVANGFAPNKRLRVTLIASPEPSTGTSSFPLVEWPGWIAEEIRQGKFMTGPAGTAFTGEILLAPRMPVPKPTAGTCWPAAVPGTPRGIRAKAVGYERLSASGKWDETIDQIKAVWREAFEGSGNNPEAWTTLHSLISRSLAGNSFAAAFENPPDERDHKPVGQYPTPPTLGEHGLLNPAKPNQDSEVKLLTVIPAQQGELAFQLEIARAQGVIDQIKKPVSDVPDFDLRAVTPPSGDGTGVTGPRNSLQSIKEKALKEAMDATLNDRRRAYNTYKEMTALLVGRMCSARPRVDITHQNLAAPNQGQRHTAGKTQVYGNWAQAGSRKTELDAQTDRIAQIFFALQGDPGFSRLFGLAIDLEIDERDAASLLADGEYWFVSGDNDQDSSRPTPRVWTAAKLGDGNFWPAPRDEMNLPDGSDIEERWKTISNLDQYDGLVVMGAGADQDQKENRPRYGLTSLDMRRAAEATGDANPGEPSSENPFKTAGFIVIDRLRALEAARTLAVTASIKTQIAASQLLNERPVAFLYAEELTIGKRLDVAVPGKAADTDRWRTLMSRTIEYDFRINKIPAPLVTVAINMLIGQPGSDERFAIDASSLTFASRLLPRDKEGLQVDAVVEEAIAQWDGTPMAVYCGPRRADRQLDADERARQLPFRRTLGLPTGKRQADLCIPPLRYGAGYRFSMRSTFLGGGSVMLYEDGRHLRRPLIGTHSIEGMLAYPPRFKAMADGDSAGAGGASHPSRRRFLRQEPVGAPDVLLPGHVALRKNGTMGFEQAGRAVLRGLSTQGSRKPQFLAGAPYVPAEGRVGKWRSTMRIIVAPEVSQDEALRLGVLNAADRKTRLLGGMRDVRRDRIAVNPDVAADPKVPATRPAGYPLAVTRSSTGFGATVAEHTRSISYEPDTVNGKSIDPTGEAAFIPGQGGPRLRYLPDPSAEVMVLRLKHRATGRYLRGCVLVDLYDGGIANWPNARPVAIEIISVPSRKPPQAAQDIVKTFAATTTLSEAGTFGDGGARVRRVTLTVAPFEDFELESFCLPNVQKLADQFSLPEIVAAIAQTKGISPDDLKAVFGDGVGDAINGRMNGAVGFAPTSKCCTIGGHAGPSKDLAREVAVAICEYVSNIRPIAEIAAVATFRVSNSLNRPDVLPAWPQSQLPVGSLNRVAWIKQPGLIGNLFGPPSQAKRPAPVQKDVSGIIAASALAEVVASIGSARGSKDYLLTGSLTVDLSRTDAFEIIARTVSPRSPDFDDETRHRSRKAKLSGRWPSLLDAKGERRFAPTFGVYGFQSIEPDGRVTLAESEVTLLRCEALPVEGATPLWPLQDGNSVISLGMVHEAARRGVAVVSQKTESTEPSLDSGQVRRLMFKSDQVHTFPDGKARLLKVRAVASSRFASDWQTADRFAPVGDRQAAELARRQALAREEQTVISDEIEIWLPATERPTKCVAQSPMPVFRTRRSKVGIGDKSSQVVERYCSTRIYLSRGWFSSGQSERLGVVVWPSNHFDPRQTMAKKMTALYGRPLSLSEFSDEVLGPGGDFITRWGGDPVRWDSAPETDPLIAPKSFVDVIQILDALEAGVDVTEPVLAQLDRSPHKPRLVKDAIMPIPVAAQEAGETKAKTAEDKQPQTMRVALVTYEPCFDADREEWYVDIEIAPSRSSDPFIRFGLVRYQLHAPEELQVSEPIVVWSQVLPKRRVELATNVIGAGEDRVLLVEADVNGLVSNGVKHLRGKPAASDIDKDPVYDVLDWPYMKMTVIHEQTSADGQMMSRTPIAATTLDPHPSVFKDGVGAWRLTASIPRSRLEELGDGAVYAFIEEIEKRMPASYANEPLAGPAALFDVATLVESGPRFAARIPFPIPSQLELSDPTTPSPIYK